MSGGADTSDAQIGAQTARKPRCASDLQGPQRQRSVHPDNQLPAEQEEKNNPAPADGGRGKGGEGGRKGGEKESS